MIDHRNVGEVAERLSESLAGNGDGLGITLVGVGSPPPKTLKGGLARARAMIVVIHDPEAMLATFDFLKARTTEERVEVRRLPSRKERLEEREEKGAS